MQIVSSLNRPEDTVRVFSDLIHQNPELSPQEIHLLAKTYKSCINERRKAISITKEAIEEQTKANNPEICGRLKAYLDQLQKEMKGYCIELTNQIESKLIQAFEEESIETVLLKKLQGDIYRYLCEISNDEKLETFKQHADDAYQEAIELGEAVFEEITPEVLGLILNYCVFMYEVMDEKEDAIQLAEDTYSSNVKSKDEEITRQIPTSIESYLQLLRDNITLWKQSEEQS